MQDVKMKRERLLAVLVENREKHMGEYQTARDEWELLAIEALAKAADDARISNKIDTDPLGDLPKPKSYLESYDDAITRVEFDERDELTLDFTTFAAWVQDKWQWRGAFHANTSMYSVS